MRCVCGQLRGVTLERNNTDYFTGSYQDYEEGEGGKIVVDGMEWKE